MKISKKARRLPPSTLVELFKKTKKLIEEGRDIIQLGIGDPENETPKPIKTAGIKAIKEGKTHYIPTSGSRAIKEAIAARYVNCPTPPKTNEVLVSGGSRIMLSAIFWAILDPGDRILIPSPYYPSFVRLASDYDAEIIDINTKRDNFFLKAQAVEEAISKSPETPKAIIINTPNNPTGAIYEKSELKKICALCEQNDILVISDECYKHFSKDGFSVREISDQAVIIDSCSKEFFMTGWRVGWGVMPEEIAQAVKKYLDLHISSFSAISEAAAIEALHGKGGERFAEQKQIITDWLVKNNLKSTYSTGSFYVFPNFSQYIQKFPNGSVGLAHYLLEDASVALAPGIDFGEFDDYLRIAYCVKPSTLKKALSKIEASLSKL